MKMKKEKNIILNDIKILFKETADKLLKKELIKAERKKLKKQMKKNKKKNIQKKNIKRPKLTNN